jgi:hypothetical protein
MCPLDGSKFKRLQLDQADLGETWTWSGFPKKLKRIHSDHGVSFLEKGDLRYIKGSFFSSLPRGKKKHPARLVESDGSIHFGFPKKSKNGARNHQKPGP